MRAGGLRSARVRRRARARARRRASGHPARALLRPGLRVRVHPGHEPARGRPDVGWSLPRDARPRGALVGVERLRVADERDGRRRGRRPAGDARLDGGDVRRRPGGPGRLRRRRRLFGVAYLLVRLLHLVLSAIVSRDDPDRRGAIVRFAPTAIARRLAARAGRLPRRRRAHRGLAGRAGDRLPRPGRDRRRTRLEGRARALRRAARADHPDRARRVPHRHRPRRRARAR